LEEDEGVRLTGDRWGEKEIEAEGELKKMSIDAVTIAHMRRDSEVCECRGKSVGARFQQFEGTDLHNRTYGNRGTHRGDGDNGGN
jgi:hypothetical protein